MEQIFSASIFAGITMIVLPIILLWVFLYTVIKSAVKNGIIAAHEEIKKSNSTE